MRIAISAREDRIAPVFDVAPTIVVVEDRSGQVVQQNREQLPMGAEVQKAIRLAELGVETLVCGAISNALEMMVSAYGIKVVAFVAGDVDDILRAFLVRRTIERYVMPGCTVYRRRLRGFTDVDAGKKEVVMKVANPGGMGQGGMSQGGKGGMGQGGQGGGRGRGRGGARGGRKGGAGAGSGSQGVCVCPQCGQQQEHQRGVPCYERTCPQCGTALIRQ